MTEEEFLAALHVVGIRREYRHNGMFSNSPYTYWWGEHLVGTFFVHTCISYEAMFQFLCRRAKKVQGEIS